MKLSNKLALLISSVLVSFAIIFLVFSNLFFNFFYIYENRTNLNDAYKKTSNVIKESDIYDPDLLIKINEMNTNPGLNILIFDKDGKNINEFSSPHLIFELGLSVESNKKTYNLGESIYDYELYLSEEGQIISSKRFDYKRNNKDFRNFAIIGKVIENEKIKGYIFIYTPYVTARNNSKIFNALTLYITIMALIITIILSYIVSNRFTRNLKEAEKATKRMADMDFSQRIEVKSNDEVGQLSISINKLSDNLEKTINDLKDANQKLEKDIELKEKVNKLKEEFISDVSHELKTPIAIIEGYSEALKLEGLSKEDIDSYADIIIDESLRMNRMVKDLIKFTQIESGFVKLNSEDFQIKDLVDEILKPLQLKINEKNINLNIDIKNSIVSGDYDMMGVVLNNYITNAINHVSKENIISISGKVIDNKYHIEVFNSGSKIDSDEGERIWDSFYKVDKARSRSYGGSGLGLSIVKSIMEIYKNKYGFISNDSGVTFYFDLNLKEE